MAVVRPIHLLNEAICHSRGCAVHPPDGTGLFQPDESHPALVVGVHCAGWSRGSVQAAVPVERGLLRPPGLLWTTGFPEVPLQGLRVHLPRSNQWSRLAHLRDDTASTCHVCSWLTPRTPADSHPGHQSRRGAPWKGMGLRRKVVLPYPSPAKQPWGSHPASWILQKVLKGTARRPPHVPLTSLCQLPVAGVLKC